jgi:hypothetical protein
LAGNTITKAIDANSVTKPTRYGVFPTYPLAPRPC